MQLVGLVQGVPANRGLLQGAASAPTVGALLLGEGSAAVQEARPATREGAAVSGPALVPWPNAFGGGVLGCCR